MTGPDLHSGDLPLLLCEHCGPARHTTEGEWETRPAMIYARSDYGRLKTPGIREETLETQCWECSVCGRIRYYGSR